MSTSGFEDFDELAGEYVLGTLPYARRVELEQQLPGNARLYAAVRDWHERLLPLTVLAEPVEPSVQLWGRIEGSVQAVSAGSSMRASMASGSSRQDWWNSLGFWRGLAGAGIAAAAITASVMVTQMRNAPVSVPEARYIVVLVAPTGNVPGWVVQATSPGQLSLIPLGETPVPPEKSLQFWTKADSWDRPVSLGLVKPGQAVKVPLDKLPPLQANQLFELTLEPANGSPTGRPTGPIQFIGRAVQL
jgi:anti-sigma-K factor RskA